MSAQGPLVLGLGLKGFGLRVWGQGLTIFLTPPKKSDNASPLGWSVLYNSSWNAGTSGGAQARFLTCKFHYVFKMVVHVLVDMGTTKCCRDVDIDLACS